MNPMPELAPQLKQLRLSGILSRAVGVGRAFPARRGRFTRPNDARSARFNPKGRLAASLASFS
jgi:hypothetical protein